MNQTVLTSVAHSSRYVIADQPGFRLRSALGEHEIMGEVLGTAWRTMHLGGKEEFNPRSYGVWGDPGEYILGQTACRWTWDGESVIGQHESSAVTETLGKADLAF